MEYKPRRVGHARASREGVSCKICMADGSGHQLRNSQEAAVSLQRAAQPSTATFDWRKVVVGNAASQHNVEDDDGANQVTADALPIQGRGARSTSHLYILPSTASRRCSGLWHQSCRELLPGSRLTPAL